MRPANTVDLADYARRRNERLERQAAHARRAAAFKFDRLCDTLKRYGPPPEELVEVIREDFETCDVQVLLTLIGGRGRVIALIDGHPSAPDPYAEAEIWRHLHELADRMARGA